MISVESILLDNIEKPDSLFIFPTDISASRWADHLLRLKGGTIAMNKFTAWDVFKQNSIKSKVQNKKSIPSSLRKIFVSRLVHENAESASRGEETFFSSLILRQWANQSVQFTSWLTDMLPQLGSWFRLTTGLNMDDLTADKARKTASNFTGDDIDMYALSCRYASFLNDNKLFEPAWEIPPFNDEGKYCFIFFPESLSDYSEYSALLSQSGRVKIINACDTDSKPCDAFFYTNSRSEITEAALYIRALNEKHGIAWESIALCIPDSQNYEPYVLREFSNRNIPYVKRTSRALADYPAGRFFRCAADCCRGDFSFSSLVSLITNNSLPWKYTDTIEKLIQFGIENNCLYSWAENVDEGKEKHINIWEDAFSNPVRSYDQTIREYFTELKKRLINLRNADSFANLRRQYFIFRGEFFDMDKCGEESDLVLSRCISELVNLAELEKSFPDVPAVDPFLFFTDLLGEVLYLPQTKKTGVAILPYKTAAASPFDCHIILGAGHEGLSVIYSRLGFLSGKKRSDLGIKDEDASEIFINLHKFNSVKQTAFFCSEHTFSCFTIPHPKTLCPSEPIRRYAQEKGMEDKFTRDYFDEEEALVSLYLKNNASFLLHENQIKGFISWSERRKRQIQSSGKKSGASFTAAEEIKKIINAHFLKDDKYRVSASSLHTFYTCSLKWLFERVFSLQNIYIETSLMAENTSGLVFHAVLNAFFIKIKNNKMKLPEPLRGEHGIALPSSCKEILKESIEEIFSAFPVLKSEREMKISALTARLLLAEKEDFLFHLETCLSHFLLFFSGCIVAGSESHYTLNKNNGLLNGDVDCILKNESKDKTRYIIVDFKRKNLPNRADCTAEDDNPLSDFQLPMYITLTEENEKIEISAALFYSVLNLKPEVIIGSISETDGEKTIPAKTEKIIERGGEKYENIKNEFNSKTEQFINEISSGSFTVFPQNYNDCFNCEYHRICRTVYVIDRENFLAENE